MTMEKSCGAVVYTRRNGQTLFAIVQEQSGRYGFPKGHVEDDETEADTARREVFEETGLLPVFLDGFRETDEYEMKERPGVRKRVVYFLAECGDEPLTPREGEIRQILLLPYEQAMQHFEHEGTRRVLRAANQFIMRR